MKDLLTIIAPCIVAVLTFFTSYDVVSAFYRTITDNAGKIPSDMFALLTIASFITACFMAGMTLCIVRRF